MAVRQVASHYYYHLHSTTDRFHWRAVQYPLEEWVTVSPDGQDVQTQFMSGVYGGANASTYRLAADHLRTVRGRTRPAAQRENMTDLSYPQRERRDSAVSAHTRS